MPSHPIRSPMLLLLATLALWALGGCWHYSAGDAGRLAQSPAVLPADAWPPRDPEAVRPLLDGTPGWLYNVCLTDVTADTTPLDNQVREYLSTPRYIVEHAGIHGNGLIRVYQRSDSPDRIDRLFDAMIQKYLTGFTPNASFVTSRTLGDRSASALLVADRFAEANTTLRARGEPYEWQSPDEQALLTSGVDLCFPPVNVSTHRGLILHLQSIAGNDYEPQVLNFLRARGWAIVDIKTATHVVTPVPAENLPRIEAAVAQIRDIDEQINQRNESLHARGHSPPKWRTDPLMTKRLKVSSELSRLRAGSYQLNSEKDLDPVARKIAADVDQTLAGNAYAVEAALDYIRSQRQDLLGGPIVVMGFSAGALAAPTVVARIRDQVDAVVMVGGGANLFMLAQRSEFTDGGVIVRNGDEEVSKSTLKELDRLYLQYSRLDPYHTAECLRGLPVLQLDATMDTWVPTAGNDLLYKRLGRPDRLRAHLAGHMMLFYFLPSQSERIANWLENNTPPRAR